MQICGKVRAVIFFLFFILFSTFSSAETYVVCVGIGHYADPKVSNLTKTENDAKALAAFYKKGTENVELIIGSAATKRQILSTLAGQFERAASGDRIVFFFSGHGYPGGFCPYDMSKIEDGLTYADVISIMKRSKATSKFIFADACNSGSIRQSGPSSKPQIGNVMLFLSSRGRESSIESPFMSNGYFTKYLLRGLRGGADENKDRKITASELFKFVSRGVVSQSGDRQHPVMWGNFDNDLVVVSYGRK